MYKILLVDDEIWVIRGLLKAIPWSELGFEVIYHTTDSSKAKENIALLKPDVVITDIRMASLTGIDLLEYTSTLEEAERPYVILISAYEEFEYAHRALLLGAFDYLIKPLKKTDMVHTLERLKTVLDERSSSRIRHIEKQIFEQYTDMSAPELFHILHPDAPESLGQEQQFQIFACAKRFFSSHTIADVLGRCPDSPSVFLEDSQFFYTIRSIAPGMEQNVFSAIRNSAAEYMIYLGASPLFTEGTVFTHIQQARYAALQFLIELPEEITLYQQEHRLSKKDNIYVTLQEAISHGNGEILWHLAHGSLELIRRNHYTIQDLIGIGNYICINLPSEENDIFQKSGIPSILVFLERYKSVEDYLLDLEREIKLVFPEIHTGGITAEDICSYIDKHYMEKILVRDIADHFHLDLNYINRLFKKTSGKNLKDYLAEKRLEKAKYLLANTDLKVFEISEASGYSDYYYFTKVFRKMAGCTPSEWRDLQKEADS